MKIVTVEYRRLRTFGSYQNETVGAVAEVQQHESPNAALQELRDWVDQQLGDAEHAHELSQTVRRKENRLCEINTLLGQAARRWKSAKQILAAHGIEVPTDHGAGEDLEGLPF